MRNGGLQEFQRQRAEPGKPTESGPGQTALKTELASEAPQQKPDDRIESDLSANRTVPVHDTLTYRRQNVSGTVRLLK